MTAPAAPVVAHNRFPTVVTGPNGATVREARTVIVCPDGDHPARLMVWAAPGEPVIDAELDLDASTIGRPRETWLLVTKAGTYSVAPGRGCGCSHPLKRYVPEMLQPLRMGQLP